jgi:hypothetical protein
MDGTTGQGQFSVDLRQHPRLRVSAPFVCSFSRLGLAKWLGAGGRHRVVFDVSMRGAKVMSEAGIQRGDQGVGDALSAQSGVADDGGGSDGALGEGAGLRPRVCRSVPGGRDAPAKVYDDRDETDLLTPLLRPAPARHIIVLLRTVCMTACRRHCCRCITGPPRASRPSSLVVASSSAYSFEIALAAPFPYNGFPIRPCPVRIHERSGPGRIVLITRCIGPPGSVWVCSACCPCFPIDGNSRLGDSVGAYCTGS